jgi:hypothetical protein
MEAIEKTEELIRQERAVVWAKRLLESKRELEKKMEFDYQNSPKIRAIVKKLNTSIP